MVSNWRIASARQTGGTGGSCVSSLVAYIWAVHAIEGDYGHRGVSEMFATGFQVYLLSDDSCP